MIDDRKVQLSGSREEQLAKWAVASTGPDDRSTWPECWGFRAKFRGKIRSVGATKKEALYNNISGDYETQLYQRVAEGWVERKK